MSNQSIGLDSVSARFLQCTVCQDLLSGQVTQCKNGHNICSSHSMQSLQGKCPTCRIKYSAGSSRNRLAEEMAKQERERQQSTPTTSTTATNSEHQQIVSSNSNQTETSTNANINYDTISCQYVKDGCDAVISAPTAIRHHEQNCYFRPLTCCLATDGCNHAQIPFFDYIPHLTGLHGVKYLQGSHHLNKYLVKRMGTGQHRKFVREGSTSLFILEVSNQVFLCRAKEDGDEVNVWVAFHGHPDQGRGFRVEIQYNPQYDDIFDAEGGLNPRRMNLNYRDQPGSSRQADDDDGIYSGSVIHTTRQSWEEIRNMENYLCMPLESLAYNLKQEVGRAYATSWAITVTHTREPAQN